ncbi:hypothetical protein ERJ75_000097200 [Trypanosoma vivax]|nr:hypothetical protein ERJ75_001424000 [Trypanosoma vivax]KAH8620114.1 hypothetical protein ERJ75_000097200 [Trypanosoma vivax]
MRRSTRARGIAAKFVGSTLEFVKAAKAEARANIVAKWNGGEALLLLPVRIWVWGLEKIGKLITAQLDAKEIDFLEASFGVQKNEKMFNEGIWPQRKFVRKRARGTARK